VEEYVSVKNEEGYKLSTVSLQCIRLVTYDKTNKNGNDRGKTAFTANKQNKPY